MKQQYKKTYRNKDRIISRKTPAHKPLSLLYAKAKSQHGASILLALAVVLVCAMVAAIVIMAAAANAGKTTPVHQRNASYYAVTSAASLLIDDINYEQPTALVEQSVKTYACQENHSYVHDDAGLVSEVSLIFTSTTGATTPFMQIIEEAVNTVDAASSGLTYERDFTIAAPELDDVDVHFFMDDGYNMRLHLKAVSTASFGYELTIHIPALHDEPTKTTVSEMSDIHMDNWEYTPEALELPWRETTTLNPSTGFYEPESNEYGHSSEQRYAVTTTTTSTQLSWASPSIVKGVED